MPETLTPEEWERRCSEAGPRLARVLQRRATALALRMQSRAVDNATTRPRSRTGSLRRSIAGRVVQTGRTVASVDGAGQASLFGRTVQGSPLSVVLSAGGRTGGRDVVYAKAQDEGIEALRPKRRKWLALPTRDVKTAAGVARYASPRDYPRPLRFRLFRGGAGKSALAALVERVAGRDVVRWWLRKEVEIPATGFARRAFVETEREVPNVLRDAVDVAFGEGRP
jgi:hypothetical protein